MNKVLSELKQQLAQIAEWIIDKNDVIYLDYPLHRNVGDLLIFAGTEQFFRDYKINVRLRRCEQSLDLNEIARYVTPNTTILCHGGGNFGDIYPILQQKRENLVQMFANNRFIFLPQTAYFADLQALQRSAAMFKQHNDCHFFARDQESFKLFQQFSSKVSLCPDMAHQLYGTLAHKQNQTGNTLYFLRKDVEKSHLEEEIRRTLEPNANICDWDDILTEQDRKDELFYNRVAKIANILHIGFLKEWVNRRWAECTNRIIQHAQGYFLQQDLIITSRLHGHIFSCLLGVENRICDNAYGKNLGYYQQWTHSISYTSLYEKP